MAALDTKLFLLFNGSIPPWLGGVFLGITALGSLYAMPLWLSAIVLAGRVRRWWAVFHCGASVLLANGVGHAVKTAVGRTRPWLVLSAAHTYGPHEHSPSFPSGHAATSFALAVAVGLWWPRARGPVLIAAFLIGLSRIALGMHYPSDVLGGAGLGAAGSLALYPWFARYQATKG